MFRMTTAPAIGAENNTTSVWMQARRLARRPRSGWNRCARTALWTDLSPTQQLPSRLRRRAVLTGCEGPRDSALQWMAFEAGCAPPRRARRWLVTEERVRGVSVAGAGASPAIQSQPVVVRCSRRAWERPYVRAVVGIDAIASLV